MTNATTTAIRKIAAWSSRLRLADVPEPVRRVARNCIIDTLGVALAGTRTLAVKRAAEFAAETAAAGSSSLLTGGTRLAAPAAALVNGAAAHALDFDDNCYAGFVHGSAVVTPAVLAAAEACNASGADLLTAFIAGAEAEYAVGEALTATIYEKGWWTTGTLGPIGATAAVARVLGLDAAATASALGIATAGTGAGRSVLGTDAKPLLCGRAAEAGVTAALLAARGVTGPVDAFESRRGFARLFNDGRLEAAPFDELGRRWFHLDPGIDVKRIPVCLSSHTAVDALIEILAEHRMKGADVAKVECDVTEIIVSNLVYPRPKTPREAQFSMEYALACVLVHGDMTLDHLEPAAIADRRAGEAMEKVSMRSSGRWKSEPALTAKHPEAAVVTVTTREGRRFEKLSGNARGMAARPLADAEIAAKFLDCARRVVEPARAEALLGRLQQVERLGSASEVLGAAV